MPPSLVLAVRIVLMVAFAWSAASKIRHPSSFRRGVAAYGIPQAVAGSVAAAISLGEFALVVILYASPSIGLPAASGGLAVFTAAQAWAIGSGRQINCHCFGEDDPVGASSLLRTVVLLSLAVIASVPAIAGDADPLATALALAAICLALMWTGAADPLLQGLRSSTR